MPGLAKNSLAEHIVAALAPLQSEGLLSPSEIDRICHSEAGALPAGITSRFGFECRLTQDQPVADFLVRVGAQREEWSVLEHYAASQEQETWRRIRELLTSRRQPGSTLPEKLRNLWLEYDLSDPASAALGPSVFFGTQHLTKNAHTGWAIGLVEALGGEPLSGASRNTLDRVLKLLSEHAAVFQVGVMSSRPKAPLRVCVNGLDYGEFHAFLAAARWPGDWQQLDETLRRFVPVTDSFALDLDILGDGRLAPKLGVELYQSYNIDLKPRLLDLVSRLNDSHLCLPLRSNGLLAWSGITHERRYPHLWPAALLALRTLRGGSEKSTFCRWLHHVKLVFEPDTPPIAKAYLAVSHAYLADSAIREALNRENSLSL